ncbi:PREDICTED: proteoglycan 3-like [Bison bison bison]|uniref:Proteoglycan 3-like n=1 Tax=Bison bison bison TaxID=43346 RepID=A0A6P3GZZ0_BISBB|nr:PREDICTED: proteoglycan 3-like [Bison bison bison]
MGVWLQKTLSQGPAEESLWIPTSLGPRESQSEVRKEGVLNPLLGKCDFKSMKVSFGGLKSGRGPDGGTRAPEKDAPHVGSPETQADLSQDAEGSGGQEGELALSGEVVESGGAEAEDTHDDEGDSESDPDDLDEDVQCPKEEETVQLLGTPGCKSCRYLMVQTPNIFRKALSICKKCYGGNLISIHNLLFDNCISRWARRINQAKVWIGVIIKLWGVTGDELHAKGGCPSSAPTKLERVAVILTANPRSLVPLFRLFNLGQIQFFN